jgi:glycosidase
MFRSAIILFLLLTLSYPSPAQQKVTHSPFRHVEPAFWWIGMKNPEVQIVFHNPAAHLSESQVSVHYKGVSLKKIDKTNNPHYLFVTLAIDASAQAGQVPLSFKLGKKFFTYSYELRNKVQSTNRIRGFNASDVLYLIMPDRFANGSVKNDSVPGMYEGVHRNQPFGRHGGDIQGISDHLDYLQELGVTTLWLNPVLENNQPRASYHGYAITNLYQVDRRFGTNAEYLDLIEKCHRRGMKVVQDMVMNHIGSEHWLMKDLPEKGWIHQFPEFTRSNYRAGVISDPYQSKYDARLMSDGWFDTSMPDIDQTNPLFATYLIQNSLWWIEYAGLDGIRMDTYPYTDKKFMARWSQVLRDEYPAFNMVGESWIESVPATAYWQKGTVNRDGYASQLPAVTDFPFCFSIPKALNEEGGWDKGLYHLYNTLSQDFVYPDANQNLTFLDNHDMTRFLTSVKGDVNKLKMAQAFLLTTRGIPQLYYGDEILMEGDAASHPDVRKDFPGGWPEDPKNAFTAAGKTQAQNEAFNYLKKLLNWRKSKPVIHLGKLTHYIPEENIYVYFRHNEKESVMVVMNGNNKASQLSTKRFAENLSGYTKARNVLTDEKISNLSNLNVPALTTLVLELE